MALGGCAAEETATPSARSVGKPPIAVHYADTGFSALAGWAADNQAEALPALARSCAQIVSLPETTPLGPDRLDARAGDWQEACAALGAVPVGDDGAARAYLEHWFRPVALGNGDDPDGLFTGYFEVAVKASRTRRPGYMHPLYRRPPDLVTVNGGTGRMVSGLLKPYYSRSEIDPGPNGTVGRRRLTGPSYGVTAGAARSPGDTGRA